MRNLPFLKVTCLFCLSFVLGLSVAAQKQVDSNNFKSKELEKNLERLKGMLAKYGGYRDPDDSRKSYQIKPLKFKECNVVYGNQIFENSTRQPEALRAQQQVNDSIRNNHFLFPPPFRSVVTLDFAKIDLASIKLEAGTPSKMVFKSLNGETAYQEKTVETMSNLKEASVPISYDKKADEILELFTNITRACQAEN